MDQPFVTHSSPSEYLRGSLAQQSSVTAQAGEGVRPQVARHYYLSQQSLAKQKQ